MILNYIQFLLSFFDQGVVKSSIVSLNCETLNVPLMYVDNLHLDDFIIDVLFFGCNRLYNSWNKKHVLVIRLYDALDQTY